MMSHELRKRLLGAVVCMIGGSATVFGLMLVMNGYNQAPDKPEIDRTQEFSAAPKPKPPEKKKKPPKRRKKASRPAPSDSAPPPSLGSAIGSVGLEMPGFEPSEMQEIGDDLLGEQRPSVMTADSVDEKPRPRRQVQPELSRRLIAKQIEGSVLAEALIDASGRVQRVRIKRATPPGVFDQIVADALRQWEFEPAMYDGEPVKTWATVPFEFELR